jgi:biopolymer transport protein ExbB
MMISKLNAAMTANLQVLNVLVPLSPLLGLIGTVSGMLEVFDSMALRGSADARTMASGVSHAMICTLTGLAVSITGLYPMYYFQARAKRETEHLADQFTF